jgi:hypothetical protein
MKTERKEKDGNVKAEGIVSLAFRVVYAGDGLYSAQVLMLLDDYVVEKRTGIGTTLGHAIGGADDLLDGWAFNEIEQKPEDYFRNVFL